MGRPGPRLACYCGRFLLGVPETTKPPESTVAPRVGARRVCQHERANTSTKMNLYVNRSCSATGGRGSSRADGRRPCLRTSIGRSLGTAPRRQLGPADRLGWSLALPNAGSKGVARWRSQLVHAALRFRALSGTRRAGNVPTCGQTTVSAAPSRDFGWTKPARPMDLTPMPLDKIRPLWTKLDCPGPGMSVPRRLPKGERAGGGALDAALHVEHRPGPYSGRTPRRSQRASNWSRLA